MWTVRKELDAKAGSSEARARGPLHGREQTRQAFVVMLIVVLLQLVLLSDAFRGTGTRTFLLTTRPPTRPSPLQALLDQLINTNTPLPRHHPLNLIKPPFDLINRRLLSHSNGIRITIKNNDSLPRHKPLVILALRLQDLLVRPSAKSSRRLRRVQSPKESGKTRRKTSVQWESQFGVKLGGSRSLIRRRRMRCESSHLMWLGSLLVEAGDVVMS